MNEYEEMYEKIDAARLNKKGMREAVKAMEEVAKTYGKDFLVKANKWASMNRRLVKEEARMTVSCLIDEF